MDATMLRQLARLEHEVAGLRAQVDRQGRTRRTRRWLPALLLAALLILAPLGTLAANFVDLNPGSGHNPNINAVAEVGITKGCFDTAHYCPNDFVTREQMASFLARTAGLGANPPVTNAAQLGGQPASSYVQKAGDLIYQFSPAGLKSDDTAVAFSLIANETIARVQTTTVGARIVTLPLPVPSAVFGVTLGVKAVEICYTGNNATTFIDETTLYLASENGSFDVVAKFDNQTSVTSVCYQVTDATPTAINGVPMLVLNLNFANTNHRFDISVVRLTLTPTT